MTSRLRILHVIPGFFPAVRYGGPIESVLRLCQALDPFVDLEVMTTDADGPGRLDVPIGALVDVQGVRVRYFRRWPLTGMIFSSSLIRELLKSTRQFDLVHVTGTFCLPPNAACVAARAAGRPYVVSPRGNLRTWSMRQKRWKKLPYWHMVERRNFELAAAVHVTSSMEKEDLEQLLPTCRALLVPNGVVLPSTTTPIERSARQVVFLGRLHPVKALDRLLEAMSLLESSTQGIELILAGPDDVDEWRRLSRMLDRLQPRPAVRYIGPVNGDEKSRLLASSTVLVLPSHTENFGQVVVEALAHGTPVIASRNTPWSVLEQREAGRWVPNDPLSLATAIRELVMDPARARRMSLNGRALAHEYEWPAIARAMASMYADCVTSYREP